MTTPGYLLLLLCCLAGLVGVAILLVIYDRRLTRQEREAIEKQRERETITDGFGNYWSKRCFQCGGEMHVVRPGSVQCDNCG